MGAGLSMTSVNKIKELANSREYSLALELVEHQDLTKSLNPQFLRLCGEIYIKNNRYEDARRCLLMAHRLAPESKRILYTFVELYLRMGYFRLAKIYYDMYMFEATAYDSREIEYIWNKHEHPENYGALEPLLEGYMHNLDYEWSFELYLLYKKEGKQTEADTLAQLYHASYQNSENSLIIAAIESEKTTAEPYFDVYAAEEQVDDDPNMESLRVEEKELLEADDLRMHPKEAEITVMYEDSYTPAGSEKKVQKMLKKQEREDLRKEKKLQKKRKQQEKAEAAAVAPETNTETDAITAEEKKSRDAIESTLIEPEQKESVSKDVQAEVAEPEKELNSKKQPVVEKTVAFDEFWNAEDGAEKKQKEKKSFFGKRRKNKKETVQENEHTEPSDSSVQTKIVDIKESSEQEEEKKTEKNTEESNIERLSENIETTGQAEDMIHRKGIISKDVVVVDEDDGFEAEAETVEELEAQEHSKLKNENLETKNTVSKPVYEFQTVDLAPEDFDDEYQVDDFTEKIDEEFGEMKTIEETSEEPEIEETVEEATEEPEIEEAVEEATEEPEIEETVEEAAEEPEIEETVEEAAEEPEIEETVEEAAEEPEIEETVEEAVEEPEIEETVEEAAEEPEIEETVEEAAEEPEIEETVEEAVEEPEIEETVEEAAEENTKFHVAPFTTKPEKKKLDFPVFKSSLFPDYHKETKVVENNFDEIMEEAQDKMTENMRKEEQMQREAEALLASLGISMDLISETPKAEVKAEQPVQVGPSRDELKASLKIDSVKKNLLKRVKEYR